jgi:DNA-binding transcriptional ArsR family regulator
MMTPTLNAAEATPAEMDRAVNLFKVLSHPDRLRLACALGDGRVTTQKELVQAFGWPQSTAARHVAALRGAGLITAERDGTEVHLRLGNPVALHLLETVCEWVHEKAPGTAPSGSRLGTFLKTPTFRGAFER